MIEVDEHGAFVAVGFERVEDVRDALTAAGVPFREDAPDGCTGPVYAVLRLTSEADRERAEAAVRGLG